MFIEEIWKCTNVEFLFHDNRLITLTVYYILLQLYFTGMGLHCM